MIGQSCCGLNADDLPAKAHLSANLIYTLVTLIGSVTTQQIFGPIQASKRLRGLITIST